MQPLSDNETSRTSGTTNNVCKVEKKGNLLAGNVGRNKVDQHDQNEQSQIEVMDEATATEAIASLLPATAVGTSSCSSTMATQ